MFCTKCGTRIDDGSRFCTSCGAPTSVATPAGANVTAPRLRRIPGRGKLAGVCAGFAEYFDMDLTLMRLIWLGLAIIPPHLGVIAYIISRIVLPVA
jgi:phage shock protein C